MKFRVVWLAELLAVIALLAVFGWLRGPAGVFGVLVGLLIVVLFFGSTLTIIGPLAHVSPAMAQPMGILFFLTKALVLAAALVVFKSQPELHETVDLAALGTTVIIGAVAWIVGHTIDLVRARIPTYDLPESTPRPPDKIDPR